MGTLYPPFTNLSLATSSGEVAARALVLGDHSVSGMEALEAEGSKASLRSAIGRPTLDEHLNFSGLGPFQGRLFAMLSLIVVADGMEMTVLTMLRHSVTNEFGIDKYQFAILGSVIFGGMLIGSLVGGAVADTYGRRRSMLVSGSVFCIFGLCSAAAPDLYSFAAARVLTGFGVGAMVPVADSLLLEWAPSAWRSKLVMTMLGAAFALGSIMAAGSGLVLHEYLGKTTGDWGREVWWRMLLVICTLPGLISLPWMFFELPESVHFLMVNRRHDEAQALLQELARLNGTPLAMDGQITSREYSNGLEAEHSLDWQQFAEMFCPEVRGTTLYLILTFSACGFVYYGFSFIYPHVLEQEYGVSVEDAFGQLLVVSLVEISCVFVFMFYMDVPSMGRRGAMLTAWFSCLACSILAMGVRDDLHLFQAANLLLKGMCGAAFTLVYVYAGELLPSTVRASVISVGGCFGRTATMGAPALLTAMLDLDVFFVYSYFAAVSGLALLVGLAQYRETLGEPLYTYSAHLQPVISRYQDMPWTERYFPLLSGRAGGIYAPL